MGYGGRCTSRPRIGGFVSDAEGGGKFLDTGEIVAGNQIVHKALLTLIN